MAVRICPECGGKVAQSRNDCPHCGHLFTAKQTKQCPECEELVDISAAECPVCGHYFTNKAAPTEGELSEAADLQKLQAFTYYKRLNGSYVITGLADPYVKEVVIPDNVTAIQKAAFKGNQFIQQVIIPANVEFIEDEAFADCPNLEVDIPKTVAYVGKDVLKNSKRDLMEQEALRKAAEEKAEFTIEGTVATKYTGNDTTVVIPSYVTEIGDEAFSGCSEIASITIPDSVTSIGISAFENCTGLTSITIPNSVTYIGEWAFRCCGSLTNITIPRDTRVAEDAFSGDCSVIRR